MTCIDRFSTPLACAVSTTHKPPGDGTDCDGPLARSSICPPTARLTSGARVFLLRSNGATWYSSVRTVGPWETRTLTSSTAGLTGEADSKPHLSCGRRSEIFFYLVVSHGTALVVTAGLWVREACHRWHGGTADGEWQRLRAHFCLLLFTFLSNAQGKWAQNSKQFYESTPRPTNV